MSTAALAIKSLYHAYCVILDVWKPLPSSNMTTGGCTYQLLLNTFEIVICSYSSRVKTEIQKRKEKIKQRSSVPSCVP